MGMTRTGRVPGSRGPQDAEESHLVSTPRVSPLRAAAEAGVPPRFSSLPRPLRTAVGVVAALFLAVSLVHVMLVFLYVAPSNEVSQRYSKQINMWIYPLFEQNWRLFAPDPASVTQQISARTIGTTSDGTRQVSGWFDLTAVDDAAIHHDVFPSHTSQNMLRRAWDVYVESHGNDDQSHTDRALMLQEYLRNIAVDRVVSARHSTFEAIQLRVVTRPIAASATSAGSPPPAPTNTRYLPWWEVAPDGH
jgi:hypothetical protein